MPEVIGVKVEVSLQYEDGTEIVLGPPFMVDKQRGVFLPLTDCTVIQVMKFGLKEIIKRFRKETSAGLLKDSSKPPDTSPFSLN
jgi:hypothetical protein